MKASIKKAPRGSAYRTGMGKPAKGASDAVKVHAGGKTRPTWNAERTDKLEKMPGGPKGAHPKAK